MVKSDHHLCTPGIPARQCEGPHEQVTFHMARAAGRDRTTKDCLSLLKGKLHLCLISQPTCSDPVNFCFSAHSNVGTMLMSVRAGHDGKNMRHAVPRLLKHLTDSLSSHSVGTSAALLTRQTPQGMAVKAVVSGAVSRAARNTSSPPRSQCSSAPS